MNKQQVKGAGNRASGEVQQQVGKLTGDSSLQARGHAREAKGKLQQGMGEAREEARRSDRELERPSNTRSRRST